MSGQADTYVELKHINKNFKNFVAGDDITFAVEKGKLVGLLGPSGSGKTTILRILAGLEPADSGEIFIAGREVSHVPASRRGIGFVFQNYALFRYRNVFDNIAFGLKVNHWKKQDIRDRVNELMELVGLTGLEDRYPKQLSGGQRQRVAIARALATRRRRWRWPTRLLLSTGEKLSRSARLPRCTKIPGHRSFRTFFPDSFMKMKTETNKNRRAAGSGICRSLLLSVSEISSQINSIGPTQSRPRRAFPCTP